MPKNTYKLLGPSLYLVVFLIFALLFSCNSSRQGSDNMKGDLPDTTGYSMTDTLKDQILDLIHTSIKSGFMDTAEIFNDVNDVFYEEPYNESWVRQQIKTQYSNKIKEQRKWPAVTDFDKLVMAFDSLNSSGIISLHNAGLTEDEAEGDCDDINGELTTKDISPIGYCYYHRQDVERVIEDGHLFIGFGDFNDDQSDVLQVGNKIVSLLQREGFKINWDKNPESRIEITNIKWQKRFGNENCSKEKAIRMLASSKN